MSHFLEFIADVLLSGCSTRKDSPVINWFVILAMGVAGISFLVFAGFAAARMDIVGILIALFLVGLSSLCFWLVWRGSRR
jgi:threonine/homoserine efflux transporter RhtA